MFVIALVELRGSVEVEMPSLAADLGITAYEAGLLLRGATPSLVLRTHERDRATALLAAMRARGHEVVAFDDVAVRSSVTMTCPRSFRLDPDAFVAVGPEEEHLPWNDVLAIVRAVHQTRTGSTTTTKEKKTSLARAALSGGLVMSKTVAKETSRTTEDREPVAYLFRASGEPPWLLAASRLRYDGLGMPLAPSQHENFELLLRAVQEHAPHADVDARLLASRSAAETARTTRAGEHSTSSASGVDVLAHVVAMAISKRPRRA